MSIWQVCAYTSLKLRLRTPKLTPLGHTVTIEEKSTDMSHRVHFTSDGSTEVYFEVGRYSRLSPEEAYEQLVQPQEQRFPGLYVSEMEEVIVDGRLAQTFTMKWPDKSRKVLFIPTGNELVRLILDPESELNRRMLASIEFF